MSSLGFIKDQLQATIGECDNGLSQHSLIYFPSVFFVIYNYIFLPYARYFFIVENTRKVYLQINAKA